MMNCTDAWIQSWKCVAWNGGDVCLDDWCSQKKEIQSKYWLKWTLSEAFEYIDNWNFILLDVCAHD